MNQSLKMAGAAVLGAGIGFAIGYKVAERQLGARFEERLEAETADMKEFYTNVKQKYNSPEEAAAALIPEKETIEDPREKPQKIQYNKIVKPYAGDPMDEFAEGCEIEETVVKRNIFEDNHQPGPRIITQEQFMQNDTGYEQITLTWYEKGGVLADQRDDILENAEDVIGPIASHNFGEGSSDPHIVHIRNDKIQLEFEVVKSERSFEEDVLGQDPN